MPKSFKEVLGIKAFALPFWAGVISAFGSFVTEEACNLWLYELGGNDSSLLGYNRATFIFLHTLGSLLGGSVGAKIKNPFKAMLFCELVRIPLVAGLMLSNSPLPIILLNGGIGFFTGIFNPIKQLTVNMALPADKISIANSMQGTSIALIILICPFLGVSLYEQLGGIKYVLYLDIATYIIGSLLILMAFRSHNLEVKEDDIEKDNSWSVYLNGLKFIKDRADLKALYINYSLIGIVIGALIPLLLPYTVQFLKGTQQSYGIILLLFGAGGLFGGSLCHYLHRYMSYGKIIVLSVAAECIFLIFFVLNLNLYLANLILFFWGIFVFIRIPAQFNHLSMTVPMKYMSRCHSLLEISFILPNVLGSLSVGFLGKMYSSREILTFYAVLFFVIGTYRLSTKSTRQLMQSPELIQKP